jgi:tRNA G18 (ribose-2'-O)-methylase SpoU
MNVTNILGIDANREVIWHVPLFEQDSQDKWQWVLEWNAEFKRINKLRKAPDKDVITRMKAFFADNPDVRKEEVIEGTNLYFKSLNSAEYLISSHYFISKGVGRDRTSALLGWIEKYREAISDTSSNNADDITSRMQ